VSTVRKYAAEQGIDEEEALKCGREEKSKGSWKKAQRLARRCELS